MDRDEGKGGAPMLADASRKPRIDDVPVRINGGNEKETKEDRMLGKTRNSRIQRKGYEPRDEKKKEKKKTKLNPLMSTK